VFPCESPHIVAAEWPAGGTLELGIGALCACGRLTSGLKLATHFGSMVPVSGHALVTDKEWLTLSAATIMLLAGPFLTNDQFFWTFWGGVEGQVIRGALNSQQ
jgi:hypothetical protein